MRICARKPFLEHQPSKGYTNSDNHREEAIDFGRQKTKKIIDTKGCLSGITEAATTYSRSNQMHSSKVPHKRMKNI